jgi:hypothetical protein
VDTADLETTESDLPEAISHQRLMIVSPLLIRRQSAQIEPNNETVAGS